MVFCSEICEGRGSGGSLYWHNHQESVSDVAPARMLDSFDFFFFFGFNAFLDLPLFG